MSQSLDDIVADMAHRIAELERRGRNRKRTGKVIEVGTGDNAGKYKVQLSEQGNKPLVTDWIRARPLAAGGVRFDVMHSVGEQVDVLSENGDLTDAVMDLSTYSDDYARENSNTPLHIKIGDTVIAGSGSELRFKSAKIVLEGEVHLGGEGGQLLHRKGDLDSDGDVATGSASRVYAV